MILQALNDYYIRMADDPDVDVPPFGFSFEEIESIITIDLQGEPKNVTVLDDSKLSICPAPAISLSEINKGNFPLKYKRTSGVAAYFLVDKGGYAFAAKTTRKSEEFNNLAKDVLTSDNSAGAALLTYLEKEESYREKLLSIDPDLEKRSKIAFRIDGEQKLIHEHEDIKKMWINFLKQVPGKQYGTCLISGDKEIVLPVHPPVKNKRKALQSDKGELSIVSFNIQSSESYQKEQSLNAATSEKAAFAYTTALNHLLAPGSSRKVQVGDTTVLFWTEAPKEVEGLFGLVMGAKESEDSDLAKRLGGLLSTLASGRLPRELGEPETPFYVLGLSPNAARISVRFWHVGTVGEMFSNISGHFQRMLLSGKPPKTPENPSPWWILKELAPQQDSRNISPLLSGQLFKSIIRNSPYPMTLLTAAIGRIRADRNIGYIRAGIIKAVLVRNYQQEINMALDKENGEIGYRLGRLFAIVERIQEEAVPGSNATVRDRFFSSASATPARTFPVILRNAQNGLAKIRKEKPGYAVNLDKLIQEILGEVDPQNGFPAALNLEKQGLFIIGYYQQRQDFFTPKQTATEA